jgi:hypothetical protein
VNRKWKALLKTATYNRRSRGVNIGDDSLARMSAKGNAELANGKRIPVCNLAGDQIGSVVEFKTDGDSLMGLIEIPEDDCFENLLDKTDPSVGADATMIVEEVVLCPQPKGGAG